MASTATEPLIIKFKVNGVVHQVPEAVADPRAPLVSILRDVIGLKGTKVGCSQGNCGACTVNVAWPQHPEAAPACVNACLFPAGGLLVPASTPDAQLAEVTTVESVLEKNGALAGFAEQIANCNGTQCGFCTPGMVMKAAYFKGLTDRDPTTPRSCRDIEDLLDGNLCRCTGYRPILYAFKDYFGGTGDGKINHEREETPNCVPRGKDGNYTEMYSTGYQKHKNVHKPNPEFLEADDFAADASRRRVVPPKPVAADKRATIPSKPQPTPPVTAVPSGHTTGRGLWFEPKTKAEVRDLLKVHGADNKPVRLVAANVNSAWIRLEDLDPATTFINLLGVGELHGPRDGIEVDARTHKLTIGTTVTIANLLAKIRELKNAAGNPYDLDTIDEHMFTISNIQVRNRGTVGGNVCAVHERNGILHSDISLLFASMNGVMHVESPDVAGERTLSVLDFQTVVPGPKPINDAFGRDVQGRWFATKFVLSLPVKAQNVVSQVARVSNRRENHPTLCSAVYTNCAQPVTGEAAAIYFTGPHIHDPSVPAFLLGRVGITNNSTRDAAFKEVAEKVPRLFPHFTKDDQRLVIHMSGRVLGVDAPATVPMLTSEIVERKVETQTHNSQRFYVDPVLAPTTEPVIKPASYEHVSGRAMYTHDAPVAGEGLNVAPIPSPAAVVQFDIVEVKRRAQKFADETEFGALILTALDIPDRRTPQQIADGFTHAAQPCNQYGGAGIVKYRSDPYSTANRNVNVLEPGDFAEYYIAPGVTTYAGQCMFLVCHTSDLVMRRLADKLEKELRDLIDFPSKANIFKGAVQDVTARKGVLSLPFARHTNQNLNDPFRTTPTVHARGQRAQWVDVPTCIDNPRARENPTAGQQGWNQWWIDLAKDPRYTVVQLGYQADGSVDEVNALRTPAQSHMYMETHAAVVRRVEDRIDIQHSTQSPTDVQNCLFALFGVPASDVVVHNNRVGGGFGGKTTNSAYSAAWAGIAMMYANVPAKCVLDRQVDMRIMGINMAFEGRYRAAVDRSTGKIIALDMLIDADSGCSSNTTAWIMLKCAIQADNFYDIPEFRVRCSAYMTHTQKGNPMRSFGSIQALQVTETAIDHAFAQAKADLARLRQPIPPPLNGDIAGFRQVHFYRHNAKTPWPRTPHELNPRSWTFSDYYQELLQTDLMNDPQRGAWHKALRGEAAQDGEAPYGYVDAVRAAKAFNLKNKVRKQAVAIMPLIYAGGYEYAFLNQNVATINVNTKDGHIVINQAGVEMGNGCQINIALSAAAALNVPLGNIRMGDVNTDMTPNPQSTGASSGSDLNVPAVVEACNLMRARLEKMLDNTLYAILMARTTNAAFGPLSPFALECFDKSGHGFARAAREKDPRWVVIQNHVKQMPIGPTEGPSDNAQCLNSYVQFNRSWKVPLGIKGLPNSGSDNAAAWAAVWTQVANLAYALRISLQETGKSDDPADGSRVWNMNNMACYFNYAAAWSHVEVDGVTGEVEVLRYDIFYDAGGSRNPAVDIGQIEGAAVQGLGNMISEVVSFDVHPGATPADRPTGTGRRITDGIMAYAIPDHRTIPRSMNVSLFWKDGGTPQTTDTRSIEERAQPVRRLMNKTRSKTTGEPPLCMAVTMLMAAREAIMELQQSFYGSRPVFTQVPMPMVPPNVLTSIHGPAGAAGSKQLQDAPGLLATASLPRVGEKRSRSASAR